MFDPLALKSLVDDYIRAQRIAGLDVPYQVAWHIVVESLKAALTTGFDVVSKDMKGLDLLIVQHALAQFELLCFPVIDDHEASVSAGAPEPGEPV